MLGHLDDCKLYSEHDIFLTTSVMKMVDTFTGLAISHLVIISSNPKLYRKVVHILQFPRWTFLDIFLRRNIMDFCKTVVLEV